eukprot:12403049-Karenia_brevis.AAC.1
MAFHYALQSFACKVSRGQEILPIDVKGIGTYIDFMDVEDVEMYEKLLADISQPAGEEEAIPLMDMAALVESDSPRRFKAESPGHGSSKHDDSKMKKRSKSDAMPKQAAKKAKAKPTKPVDTSEAKLLKIFSRK